MNDDQIEEQGPKVKSRRRGIYLLPNLFTTGALFCGFYSILASQSGKFEAAAIAIVVAMVLDGLDGRIARLTNTSTQFGIQYDSLSDMVSFGIAPAVLLFHWGLPLVGKIGWTASFIFAACAALRLARFNSLAAVADKRFFTGLASPAAAGTLAAIVWVWHDVELSKPMAFVMAGIVVMLGLLMVSNIRYNSLKVVDFKGRVPYTSLLLVILGFAAFAAYPAHILLCIGIVYGSSGPISWFKHYMESKK